MYHNKQLGHIGYPDKIVNGHSSKTQRPNCFPVTNVLSVIIVTVQQIA